MNVARTQPEKPEPGSLSKGRRECAAQNAIGGPMEEHQGLETLEVIERIGGAIVKLGLGHPELRWDDFTHDVRRERWLRIELGIKGVRGSDLEGLKMAAHVIDLVSKVDASQVYGRKGFMIVRGLDGESRNGGVVRFETLIT